MGRIQNDAYYTPPDLARAVVARTVPRLEHRQGQRRILEPSVGTGNLARALSEALPGCHITGVEIDPQEEGCEACNLTVIGDFLKVKSLTSYDLILANPPYNGVVEHISRALDHLAVGGLAAFLVRSDLLNTRKLLSLCAGRDWYPRWEDRLVGRPSFVGTNGTGRYNYSLVTWSDTNLVGVEYCETRWLDWREVSRGQNAT